VTVPGSAAAATSAAPGTGAAPKADVVDWYDVEGPLSQRSGFEIARVLRRAVSSWPLWVGFALLLGALVARSRAHKQFVYEASVSLQVREGNVGDKNNLLSLGELRDQIDELAFSRERLAPILRKHQIRLDDSGPIDSPEAIAAFRSLMTITLSENDFIEDDQSSESRRSARVEVTYSSTDNVRAHKVARDIADLIANSGLERQKKILEAEAMVTREIFQHASDDLARIRRESSGDWTRLKPAVERFAEAQKAKAAAALALNALSGRQALGFEIVDPGRVPPLVNRREVMINGFFSTVVIVLLAGCLLAGVFDPRVIDVDDLNQLGVEVLGRLPAVPSARRMDGPEASPAAVAEGSERPAPRV
jgi:hypothetical protein